ncbi:MAG: hypothetical protein LBU32_18795 [Clostridiales bacterium]|nr:hypothetical protein [Clostridiales bacterium]
MAQGEGYAVTAKNGAIRIVAYHYCHYDKLYLEKYAVAMSVGERYHVFVEKMDLCYRFALENMPPGEYEIEFYSVGRSGGSAFDAWVAMGMPSQLRPTRLKYMMDISNPFYSIVRQNTENGILSVEMSLKPHQVLMAIVSQIK